jgi:AcrR family transcriptional regulator
VSAAEKLFAERGIDAVSLVEIGRVAGQRNRSAVQYHFGDKAALLAAIRAKHAPGIERERGGMLDDLGAGRPPLRKLVEALVIPVAHKVQDRDGGEAYVRINAALIGHPGFPLLSQRSTRENRTADRLFRGVVRATPKLPEALREPRMLLVTGLVFHGIADNARLARRRGGRAAWNLYVSHLVDCVLAVLEAPVSEDTKVPLREVS